MVEMVVFIISFNKESFGLWRYLVPKTSSWRLDTSSFSFFVFRNLVVFPS